LSILTHKYGALVIALLCGIAAFPQGPSPISNPPASTASSLLISVRSKEGPVDLAATDLEIREDGKPVRILQIRKLDQPPIRYCILFDVSNSERDQFKLQQETAIRLVRQVVRPKTDQGWVNLFSVVSSQSEETDDPDAIARTISASRAGGGTALYDAIEQGTSRMSQGPLDSRLRTIFVFSDGDDNQSHITHERVTEMAAVVGVRIYAIGPDDSHHAHGSSILKKIAEGTGGEFFTESRLSSVDRIALQINSDLRNVFAVAYETESGKPDTGPRKIDVECSKKGTTILAPKWTYAPRP
jgi:Ca-activated chloride channel family protein